MIAAIVLVLGVAAPSHALDPLNGDEIRRAVSVLKESGRLGDSVRFGTITVNAPDKTGPSEREARLLGFDWERNEAFVSVVDVVRAHLNSWEKVADEPPMRLLTIRRAEEIAFADPRFVAAMRERKIDPNRVEIQLQVAERARLATLDNDRIVTGVVRLLDGVPDALLVNGLTLTFNLTRGRLVAIDDRHEPLRRTDSSAIEQVAHMRAPLPPLRIAEPEGRALRIDGNHLTWDHWSVRVGIDPRRGLEVHDVAFRDGDRLRPVLYSGSVSEMITPYGDAAFGTWYPRDEGDYGMGLYGLISSIPLNDAPPNAELLPATTHDDRGRPVVVPRAIAVYERDGGLLWRHSGLSRRARQLVVSAHGMIDGYDYEFNWVFGQEGTIEGEVLLSGVMNINSSPDLHETAHVAGHAAYNHLVAPEISAPNHQHFFSYRLDLDVDGTANTVYAMESRSPDDPRNPRGELIEMLERPLLHEADATMDVSFASVRSWRVLNTHQTNSIGQFTGYTLVPGAATPALSRPGSEPMRTAGFIAHQLWVTPYSPDEQYAAGEFQNLGLDGEGLPKWTRANRSLSDADVVLWYTLGITHIPRPEDWPYMPVHRGGFRLVPTSFFSRNPTLDMPPQRP